MKGIAKYQVGDKVLVTKTNENGTIKSVVSELDGGNSLYVVSINGLDKLYTESYLELVEKSEEEVNENPVVDINMDSPIEDVIKELGLEQTNDEKGILINALKVSRYMATRDELTVDMEVKDNVKVSDMYKGLLSQEESYIANSYLFNEILTKLGIQSIMVGLKDEENVFYIANMVLIGDKYYYFDNTLEREVYLDNCDSPEEFAWCCAALGSESYEQFFKPVCVVALNQDYTSPELPDNISKEDYNLEGIEID